jgi:hypothetical protein
VCAERRIARQVRVVAAKHGFSRGGPTPSSLVSPFAVGVAFGPQDKRASPAGVHCPMGAAGECRIHAKGGVSDRLVGALHVLPAGDDGDPRRHGILGPNGSAVGGRSSFRHQDLREGSASEALLFDDVELQVLVQVGERAVARADRNRDR